LASVRLVEDHARALELGHTSVHAAAKRLMLSAADRAVRGLELRGASANGTRIR